MPVISRFCGIAVFMHYDDHLPPHFHARYQDEEVTVDIEHGIVTGRMSKRPLRMVLEWAEEHRGELIEDWDRARAREPLKMIPPLS